MKVIMPNRVAASIALLLLSVLSTCCGERLPDVYAPIGSVAKVSEGEMFGLQEREVPFADSPTAIRLYMEVRGVNDIPAIKSMVGSGRVIFVPMGTYVDVLAHDQKETATKVRIRGGTYVGREVWTHPKFVTKVN